MTGQLGRYAAAALACALAACTGDGEALDGAATTVAATTGSMGTSGTSSSTGAVDGSSSSGGPSGPPQCVRACAFPGDCCPPGSEGKCPSPNFPYAFACVNDLCVPPECAGDGDCPSEQSCIVVDGAATCVQACTDDAECMATSMTAQCTAIADDDSRYCFSSCTTPGVSCGNADCDEASGLCTCINSSQCILGSECI